MKRLILGMLALLLLSGIVIVGNSVFQAWRYYDIEGSIHAQFYPLISALDRYCAKNRNAPAKLDDLIPEYIDEVPSFGRVAEIRYHSEPDEPRWRLTLVSRATGELRYYIAETGIPLSEHEKQDLVLEYHSRWSVLEPEQAGVGNRRGR